MSISTECSYDSPFCFRIPGPSLEAQEICLQCAYINLCIANKKVATFISISFEKRVS